jgi:hypothetical protein
MIYDRAEHSFINVCSAKAPMHAILKSLCKGILKFLIVLVTVSLIFTTVVTINVQTITQQTAQIMYDFASTQSQEQFQIHTRNQCMDITQFQNCSQSTHKTFLSYCTNNLNKTTDIQDACAVVSAQSWETFCQSIDNTKKTCESYLNNNSTAREFFYTLILNQMPAMQNKTAFAQMIQTQYPQLASVAPLFTAQTPTPTILSITLIVLLGLLWIVDRKIATLEKDIGYLLVTQSLIALGVFCATYLYIQFATPDTTPILLSITGQTIQSMQHIQQIALSLVPVIIYKLYTVPLIFGCFGALILGATLVTVAKKVEQHETHTY